MQNIAEFEIRGTIGSTNILKKVAYVSIAVNSNRRNDEGEWESTVSWHDVTCFGKSREWAERLIKGDLVNVRGSLQRNVIENKGEKDYRLTLAVKEHAVLHRRNKED